MKKRRQTIIDGGGSTVCTAGVSTGATGDPAAEQFYDDPVIRGSSKPRPTTLEPLRNTTESPSASWRRQKTTLILITKKKRLFPCQRVMYASECASLGTNSCHSSTDGGGNGRRWDQLAFPSSVMMM